MRTLTLSTGSFDRTNSFNVNVGRPIPRKASLHRDYKVAGDGVLWIMQHAGYIASSYSQSEIDERGRLASEQPVAHGDPVQVDGKKYIVRVLGDFSDCAILDPA
jgi:hypothetical protein